MPLDGDACIQYKLIPVCCPSFCFSFLSSIFLIFRTHHCCDLQTLSTRVADRLLLSRKLISLHLRHPRHLNTFKMVHPNTTCCKTSQGADCICAAQAKCSCGKESALHCSCNKASAENAISGPRCSCRKFTQQQRYCEFSAANPLSRLSSRWSVYLRALRVREQGRRGCNLRLWQPSF